MDYQNSACARRAGNQPGNVDLRRTDRLHRLCISNCQWHSISVGHGCADYLLGEEWADSVIPCVPHQPYGATNAGRAFADRATVRGCGYPKHIKPADFSV